MSPRTLTIVLAVALAVSVALNVFAATAAFAVLSGRPRIERVLEGTAPVGTAPSTREIVAALDPASRRAVRRGLRDAALRARPDFQLAREARRQAVIAASQGTVDPVQIAALLERARAAELRGRGILEAETVAILATLSPEDRRALAPILQRRARNRDGAVESGVRDATPAQR